MLRYCKTKKIIDIYARCRRENGWATSLAKQITIGGEKTSKSYYEPKDDALAGLRATGRCKRQVVVHCGDSRGRPFFNSGRIPVDDDELSG